MDTAISAERIMRMGLDFWASKVLLSAIELDLFTVLARAPADLPTLQWTLALHPRSAHDFLDALVSLGFLERRAGLYSNSAEAAHLLDRESPAYIGGFLAMASRRLFPAWAGLTLALRTGRPSRAGNEFEGSFKTIYTDAERTRVFLEAMSALSAKAAIDIVDGFAWADYQSFLDIGCAQGQVPVALAKAYPHLQGIGLDLPPVQPVFEEFVARHGLQGRVRFQGADFFEDELPAADVIVMGHILHDWDLPRKRALITRAYAALPRGGALLIYEAIIDDERRENTFGLLMSLNMLLMTEGGFDFTAKECCEWLDEAGFLHTRVVKLSGPHSLIVATK